jgi:hypothetical protein
MGQHHEGGKSPARAVKPESRVVRSDILHFDTVIAFVNTEVKNSSHVKYP